MKHHKEIYKKIKSIDVVHTTIGEWLKWSGIIWSYIPLKLRAILCKADIRPAIFCNLECFTIKKNHTKNEWSRMKIELDAWQYAKR